MAPIPKTMSGVIIPKTGGPEVLEYKRDLPVPEPQEGEILVKNELIGVNYIDIYFRSGLYPAAKMPHITGMEAAGTVSFVPEISKDAAAAAGGLREGDRVTYMHDHTYAEYTAVPARRLVKVPEALTTEVAAACLLQGLTALTLVREAASIHPTAHLNLTTGPWALVHAAAGGTGSLLVQILASAGAKVIATAGSQEKCKLAERHGAKWTINNREEDWVAKVMEITGGHGIDAVFDGVGKATFEKDLEVIARKGHLVMFGNAV